jgi:hypothetical protein
LQYLLESFLNLFLCQFFANNASHNKKRFKPKPSAINLLTPTTITTRIRPLNDKHHHQHPLQQTPRRQHLPHPIRKPAIILPLNRYNLPEMTIF